MRDNAKEVANLLNLLGKRSSDGSFRMDKGLLQGDRVVPVEEEAPQEAPLAADGRLDLYKTFDERLFEYLSTLKTSEVAACLSDWREVLPITCLHLLDLLSESGLTSGDVMDAVMLMLRKKNSSNSRLYIFLSYQMQTLHLEDKLRKQALADWHWRNIADNRTMLVPVFIKNCHWGMARLVPRSNEIYCYDSFATMCTDNSPFTFIQDFLKMLYTRVGEPWQPWTVHKVFSHRVQRNDFDCGIFALMYAIVIADEQFGEDDLLGTGLIVGRDIHLYRKMLCTSILSGTLPGPINHDVFVIDDDPDEQQMADNRVEELNGGTNSDQSPIDVVLGKLNYFSSIIIQTV